MTKLEEILQAEVEAEISEVLSEADSRAAKIVGDAKSRAEARVAEHRRRIDVEVRTAAHQARSAAELILANTRMEAKGEVMELLRQKVLDALEQVASRPDYGVVLQALAKEAMEFAGHTETLVVHPEDREKVSGWAEGVGIGLETDPELHLGVRIQSARGAIVENTLPERLRRVWGTLAPQIAGMLWE